MVAPAGPTAKAFALAEVIACAALVNVDEIAAVPVIAKPLVPMVAPLIASDVATAVPSVGLVITGEVNVLLVNV